MIPTVDVEAVAEGNLNVQTALTAALQELGNATIAYFLTLIPERGGKLWVRFLNFRGLKGRGELDFAGFIKAIVEAYTVTGLFPRHCRLSDLTRFSMAPRVLQNLKAGGVADPEEMLTIYFGINNSRASHIARIASCRCCPSADCEHARVSQEA